MVGVTCDGFKKNAGLLSSTMFVSSLCKECCAGTSLFCNLFNIVHVTMSDAFACFSTCRTGSSSAAAALASAPPPRSDLGATHLTESSTAHCFVTVDLDLSAGYVRFFRNGHLIGTAFQGVVGPVSPAIVFVQVRCFRLAMLCKQFDRGGMHNGGCWIIQCTRVCRCSPAVLLRADVHQCCSRAVGCSPVLCADVHHQCSAVGLITWAPASLLRRLPPCTARPVW